MNIVITGFMGTGKTVVSSELAGKLKYRLIDTDSIVEEEEKKKISEIFRDSGEKYFREKETDAIRKASSYDRCVIATGGGAVLKADNMGLLEKNGIIINLTASPGTIYERTKKDTGRPLLNKPDPMSEIVKLLEYREQFYRRCSYRVNTDGLSVKEVVEKCLRYIEKESKTKSEKQG